MSKRINILSTRQQILQSLSMPPKGMKGNQATLPENILSKGQVENQNVESTQTKTKSLSKRNQIALSPVRKVEFKFHHVLNDKKEKTEETRHPSLKKMRKNFSKDENKFLSKEESFDILKHVPSRFLKKSFHNYTPEPSGDNEKHLFRVERTFSQSDVIEHGAFAAILREKGLKKNREKTLAGFSVDKNAFGKFENFRSASAETKNHDEYVINIIPSEELTKTAPEKPPEVETSNLPSRSPLKELPNSPQQLKVKVDKKIGSKGISSDRTLEPKKNFKKKIESQQLPGISEVDSSMSPPNEARYKNCTFDLCDNSQEGSDEANQSYSDDLCVSPTVKSSYTVSSKTINKLIEQMSNKKKKIIEMATTMSMLKENLHKSSLENEALKNEISELKEKNTRLEVNSENQKKTESQLLDMIREKKQECENLINSIKNREGIFKEIKLKLEGLSIPKENDSRILALEEEISLKEFEINTLKETIEQFEDLRSRPQIFSDEILLEFNAKQKEINLLRNQIDVEEEINAGLRRTIYEKDQIISKYILSDTEKVPKLPTNDCESLNPEVVKEESYPSDSDSMISESPREKLVALLLCQVNHKTKEIEGLIHVQEYFKQSIQQLSELVGYYDRQVRILSKEKSDEAMKKSDQSALRRINSSLLVSGDSTPLKKHSTNA